MVDLIGRGLEVFSKLPDEYATHSKSVFTNISADIGQSVVELGKVATKIKQEMMDKAVALATAGSAVMDVIGKLRGLSDRPVVAGNIGSAIIGPAFAPKLPAGALGMMCSANAASGAGLSSRPSSMRASRQMRSPTA